MIDDELEPLEAELKRLRPAKPSPAVPARIVAQLAVRPRRAPVLRFGWVALPIAAGVAIMAGVSGSRHRTAATDTAQPVALAAPDATAVAARPARAFKPVSAQNLLLDSRDEGTATLADGTVVRRTRESYLDTIIWKDPKTNASLTWSVPREEVRVVAVSYE